MRVLDRQGDIFGTMTPLKGLTFVYDEIYLNRRKDPEVWYEFMEWSDNPYLPAEETELLGGAWTNGNCSRGGTAGFPPPRGWCIPSSTNGCTSSSPSPYPRSGRTIFP